MAKSRSLAQSYIQSGKVKINGVSIRQPSHLVKAGDRLDIGFERMDKVLVVKSGASGAGPMKRPNFYDDLITPREPSDRLSPLEQAIRQPGSGRPTKRAQGARQVPVGQRRKQRIE